MAIEPSTKAAPGFISIDQWQDKEPAKGSLFDNPFVGMLGVILLVGGLFTWGAIAPKNDSSGGGNASAGSVLGDVGRGDAGIGNASMGGWGSGSSSGNLNLKSALAGLEQYPSGQYYAAIQYFNNRSNFDPSQKEKVKESLWKMFNADYSQMLDLSQTGSEAFSIWFDAQDMPRFRERLKERPSREGIHIIRAMSKLPNAVEGLLSELPGSLYGEPARLDYSILDELLALNADREKIEKSLIGELKAGTNIDLFTRIVDHLDDVRRRYREHDDPKTKALVAERLTLASGQFTEEQFDKMRDFDAIRDYCTLPENSELLMRFATPKHLYPLGNYLESLKSKEAVKFAEKLGVEGKLKEEVVSRIRKRFEDSQ